MTVEENRPPYAVQPDAPRQGCRVASLCPLRLQHRGASRSNNCYFRPRLALAAPGRAAHAAGGGSLSVVTLNILRGSGLSGDAGGGSIGRASGGGICVSCVNNDA
jgi:hypothetical protein